MKRNIAVDGQISFDFESEDVISEKSNTPIPENFINPPETNPAPAAEEIEDILEGDAECEFEPHPKHLFSDEEIQALIKPAQDIILKAGHASVGMLMNRMQLSAVVGCALMDKLVASGFISGNGRLLESKTNWGNIPKEEFSDAHDE